MAYFFMIFASLAAQVQAGAAQERGNGMMDFGDQVVKFGDQVVTFGDQVFELARKWAFHEPIYHNRGNALADKAMKLTGDVLNLASKFDKDNNEWMTADNNKKLPKLLGKYIPYVKEILWEKAGLDRENIPSGKLRSVPVSLLDDYLRAKLTRKRKRALLGVLLFWGIRSTLTLTEEDGKILSSIGAPFITGSGDDTIQSGLSSFPALALEPSD